MRRLAEFFYGSGNQLSMMRLLCFIVTIATLPAIYVFPEQAPALCALVGTAIAGKWLQSKGGE